MWFKLVYGLMYGGMRMISALPFWMLYLFSDVTYWLMYYVVRYRRQVVWKNLRNSFPEKTDAERLRIERKFYAYLSDYLFDELKMLHMSLEVLQRRMTFKNTEQYLQLIEKHGGAILMIPHYANYEWISGICSIMRKEDLPIQVYKPLTNKYMDKLFLHIRSHFGGYNISKYSTAREIVRLRRSGRKIGIGLIIDQWPSGDRYWTTFLGQETAFSNGGERIARMMNFPVFYCELTKHRRGYCEVEFRLITATPKETAEGEITKLFAQALEQTIRREPAYWLWSHRRWKCPKKAAEEKKRV